MTRAALTFLLLATLAALLPERGVAQDVATITVGTDEVAGEVLGFDGTYLRLRTAGGEVTLHYDPSHCSGACPDPALYVPELRLSGTPRLGTLILPALIEAYARDAGLSWERQEGPEGYRYDLASEALTLRVSVRLTTTGDGLADLLAEEADVAMAGRLPSEAELERARSAGQGDLGERTHLLAVEMLVPVTSPTLPVQGASLAQLEALLSGEVLDWAALGAPPQMARFHIAAEDDETLSLIEAIAEGGLAEDRPVIAYDEAGALSAGVAGDPGGFGLVPASDVGLTRPLLLRGSCGLAHLPEPALAAAGDYPLTLPLLLVQPRRRLPPEAAAFLDWTRTASAQAVLRRAGVTGMAPQPIPLAEQGERLVAAMLDPGATLPELQRLSRFARDKQRLSPTFRFDGDRLDALSAGRLRGLASSLAESDTDRPLWLVGFFDEPGSTDGGVALSRDRAESVRDALRDLFGGDLPDGLDLRIAAFGATLPVACGETDWGRVLNDRVELWTSVD